LQDWLDDEPYEVDDLDAVKPEDQDDEEDGEWEPPKIVNPSGKRLLVVVNRHIPPRRTQLTRASGKFDNPAYHVVWAPKQILNLEFFVLEKPNLEPIIAIGIVNWTMQDGILFDNILVTRNEGCCL